MNPKMKSWARQAEAGEVVGNSLGCRLRDKQSVLVSVLSSEQYSAFSHKKKLNNRPFFDLKGVLALRLGEKEPKLSSFTDTSKGRLKT
jgi:hypothetical protein